MRSNVALADWQKPARRLFKDKSKKRAPLRPKARTARDVQKAALSVNVQAVFEELFKRQIEGPDGVIIASDE